MNDDRRPLVDAERVRARLQAPVEMRELQEDAEGEFGRHDAAASEKLEEELGGQAKYAGRAALKTR